MGLAVRVAHLLERSYTTESEDGVNWIKIGDVAVGAKYLHSTEEKIRPEGAKRSRMVYPGDLFSPIQ